MKKYLFLMAAALFVFASASQAFAVPSQRALSSIESQIASDKAVGKHDIDVFYRQGHVMLVGSVDSRQTGERIEKIARETDGVSKVRNQLVVNEAWSGPNRVNARAGASMRSDSTIESDVRAALQKIAELNKIPQKPSGLEVEVSQGIVSLSGSSKSFRDIDQILASVLNVEGVQDVESNLTIQGRPYPVSAF